MYNEDRAGWFMALLGALIVALHHKRFVA